MDDIDKRVVEALRQNSRITCTSLAKDIGLSEGTVRKRIKNLVKTGIIQRFTTDVAEDANLVRAFCLLSVKPSVPNPQVSEELRKIEGVRIVHEVTGQFDIVVSLLGSGIAEINKCIDNIRRVEGIAQTNTMIVLRTWR